MSEYTSFIVGVLTAAGLACPGPAAGPAGVSTSDTVPASEGTPTPATRGGAPPLVRADSAFHAGDARGALDIVLDFLAEEGEGYEGLWHASSYAVGLGVLEEAETGETARFRQALELAERAREICPDGIDGRYWEVAALGRVAMSAGIREASGYAERIWGGSRKILEVDPDHPGAHHALGRLYLELMGVPGIARFLGGRFSGLRSLEEASWAAAEEHLTRAVELEPSMMPFQLDLARFELERGRKEAARARLAAVVAFPVVRPPERVFREEARALLEEIR
jgi:tetratricopeptide (TPR) repeat protein